MTSGLARHSLTAPARGQHAPRLRNCQRYAAGRAVVAGAARPGPANNVSGGRCSRAFRHCALLPPARQPGTGPLRITPYYSNWTTTTTRQAPRVTPRHGVHGLQGDTSGATLRAGQRHDAWYWHATQLSLGLWPGEQQLGLLLL